MQEDLIEVERALLRLGGQTDPEAPIPNVCIRCHFKYAVFFLMKIYLSVFIWFKNINPIFKRIFKSF